MKLAFQEREIVSEQLVKRQERAGEIVKELSIVALLEGVEVRGLSVEGERRDFAEVGELPLLRFEKCSPVPMHSASKLLVDTSTRNPRSFATWFRASLLLLWIARGLL